MKLLFSETRSDYDRYQYPYVVWALPEAGETPADFYERGFLPASPDLDRFYLCRNVRVVLSRFSPSSENRRILRKGAGIAVRLIPREEFTYTPRHRAAWVAFAAERFGPGVMPPERLDKLMTGRVITHLLHFTDETTGKELGAALLYLEAPRVAHYYYAFYDLDHFRRSLGLHMMTRALERFRVAGLAAVHLGTCYSPKALYKTQFPGAEFFNGNAWSPNLEELKCLIKREESGGQMPHLLTNVDYLERFWRGRLENLAAAGGFQIPAPGGQGSCRAQESP